MDIDALALSQWADEDLAVMLDERDRRMATLKIERERIASELRTRHADTLRAAFEKAAKDHGKVAIKFDGYDIEAEIRQTVEWDGDKLRALGNTLTAEENARIFKVTIGVEEKFYKALMSGSLRDALTDARTTKLSAPSLKVRFNKENE